MMTAQCLHVPMVGHYHQAIRIKSFSEVYNSYKFWILQIHVYFNSKRHLKAKKGRKTSREEAARWPNCFVSAELGVQSWTEKKAEDFTRTAKSK